MGFQVPALYFAWLPSPAFTQFFVPFPRKDQLLLASKKRRRFPAWPKEPEPRTLPSSYLSRMSWSTFIARVAFQLPQHCCVFAAAFYEETGVGVNFLDLLAVAHPQSPSLVYSSHLLRIFAQVLPKNLLRHGPFPGTRNIHFFIGCFQLGWLHGHPLQKHLTWKTSCC